LSNQTFVPRKHTVRIVTDSAARLDPHWAAEHGVIILPQVVTIGGKSFFEDVDVSADEFAQLAAACNGRIDVQAPSVQAFSDVYQSLANLKVDIISIHISSGMSETFRMANTAKIDVSSRCTIHVVDSRTIGAGLQMLVKRAVAMAEAGHPVDAIVRNVRAGMHNIYAIFVSDDMPFLEYSGRLRPAQAYLGRMLQIIPCLTMEEGKLVAVEKVRSADRAIEKLAEFATEFEPNATFALMQIAPTAGARVRELIDALKPALPNASSFPLISSGGDIGRIIGTDGLGIMIIEDV
jgi:DegV family protein with EDD domain